MSIRESLGITDKTFDTVASYGDPSTNWGDQTSNYLMTGQFSPIQQWEMWMRKPEPQVVVIDLKISDLLNGLLEVLSAPGVAKPLSRFLKARSDK